MRENNSVVHDERVIDLRRVMRVLLKRAWVILAVAVVSALAMLIYFSYFVTPTYVSSFSAYVNNRMTSEEDRNTSSSDLTASMGLMYVYQEIIQSRAVLMEAVQYCESTDFGESNLVTCSVSETAPILRVYVQTKDPKLSYQLATAIAKVAPDHVKAVVDGSSMRTIDKPRVPKNQYYPDVQAYTTYGFLLGFFVTALLVVTLDMIHDKVQNAEELENRYEMPVIGRIPDMQAPEKSGDRYSQIRKGGVQR